MAKVMEMVRLTLMPMSCAAPRSSERASMARPVLVFLMNSVSAIMMTMVTPNVAMDSPVSSMEPR